MAQPNTAKFRIGDKVRVNNRAPKYILAELRQRRARTIVAISRDRRQQHKLYELGDRGRGTTHGYLFRPEMLSLAKGNRGRPRVKRRYQKHN